ncbi:MAG: hypothetical protein SO441_01130 [Candidatus Limivicinus sp.]|nr:hypothetical protein [Candidatus Limivicinus sp.]
MNKTLTRVLTVLVLLLAVVMLLSLAACGKEEAPAATQAPAAPAATEAPAAQTAAPTEEPAAQPSAQPEAEEGVFVSASKGFRFEYDPAYVALSNPADNAMIYPTGDVELPFCSVSLISGSSAVDYLKEMSAAAQEELGDAVKSQPGEPADAGVEGRQVYFISFTYDSFEAEGTVICSYYAEDLPGGDIVVYNATALEGDTAVADGIVKTAIETFQMD